MLSDSRFALWRSAIAIAYADGKLNDKEKDFLAQSLPHRGFSVQQKEIIEKDLAAGVKLEEVFSSITDMRDRAHLINFSRQLIQIDGEICNDEQTAIDYISKHHSDKLETSMQLAASKLEAKGQNNSYKAKLKQEKATDLDNIYLWDIFDIY